MSMTHCDTNMPSKCLCDAFSIQPAFKMSSNHAQSIVVWHVLIEWFKSDKSLSLIYNLTIYMHTYCSAIYLRYIVNDSFANWNRIFDFKLRNVWYGIYLIAFGLKYFNVCKEIFFKNLPKLSNQKFIVFFFKKNLRIISNFWKNVYNINMWWYKQKGFENIKLLKIRKLLKNFKSCANFILPLLKLFTWMNVAKTIISKNKKLPVQVTNKLYENEFRKYKQLSTLLRFESHMDFTCIQLWLFISSCFPLISMIT